jgi:NDP-4-keto-2,6-dideoxyhexose 3-C-methyltransferase
MMYTTIDKCRACGNENLVEVLDLGNQAMTGVFPKHPAEKVTAGPLRLVKCMGSNVCGLLQLQHSYDLAEMYGMNYGYRSGLNASMVKHLHGKVTKLLAKYPQPDKSLIIDIGSNDSTTLQAYPREHTLVGIDPTGKKFGAYYPAHIQLIPDFFSSKRVTENFGSRKAQIITSFSMFYDLESPLAFMIEIEQVLAADGLWIFEQSYMPTMLARNSYDTVCHEHLEYYDLTQICWMAEKSGLKIIDVELNDINGGSFSLVATKASSERMATPSVGAMLAEERRLALDSLAPYQQFAMRSAQCREDLQLFLAGARQQSKSVVGLGASTKGNVILQYCGFTSKDIAVVAEVNADKYGAFTPGSLIPIRPQAEVLAERPDYLLVLPWHFRTFFVTDSSLAGQTLLFPLPKVETLSL